MQNFKVIAVIISFCSFSNLYGFHVTRQYPALPDELHLDSVEIADAFTGGEVSCDLMPTADMDTVSWDREGEVNAAHT